MRLYGLGASVDALAAAIAKQENAPASWNNPGALIAVGQSGCTPNASGFCTFPTYDAGYQALVNQLNLYASRGLTVDQMANTYCPASVAGCDPTLYASVMANALGVDPSANLADALAGSASMGTVDASMISATDLTPYFLLAGVALAAWMMR